jgi:hypothetical protein
VREVDGRRIVSYGTSSYGYDIRCSRFEFSNATPLPAKIYTNEGVAQVRGSGRAGMLRFEPGIVNLPARLQWPVGSEPLPLDLP